MAPANGSALLPAVQQDAGGPLNIMVYEVWIATDVRCDPRILVALDDCSDAQSGRGSRIRQLSLGLRRSNTTNHGVKMAPGYFRSGLDIKTHKCWASP